MDLLTTRPRHRKISQSQQPQRRRPTSTGSNSSSSTINQKNSNKKGPQQKDSTLPKRIAPIRNELNERNQPRLLTDRNRSVLPQEPHLPIKKLIETKSTTTQTEVLIIEKKLHDSLLVIVESTLEILQKNLEKILGDKKTIEDSYGKLIEDILDKIDTKKQPKLSENKKNLELKIREYKNYLKNKHNLEKEKSKVEKHQKKVELKSKDLNQKDPLRLKRQFSLEKLTKLSLGLKNSSQEPVETPKLKRQYSFEHVPIKNQEENEPTNINDLKSRLTKVMNHFKSTETLNEHDTTHDNLIHHREEPNNSYPFQNDQKPSTSKLDDDVFYDSTLILENEDLILPPEDFQEHPYDLKRDEELEYLKSLKGKLSSLGNKSHKTSTSSEVSFQQPEKSEPKKNLNENSVKKIKELQTKLNQLLSTLQSPEKELKKGYDFYEKSEKKLLKLKVKYINIRFVQEDEFITTRLDVVQMFSEAEKIIEAGKHGLNWIEKKDDDANFDENENLERERENEEGPRGSLVSECSSLDFASETSTESPYLKLERLKIMLEQMVSDIEEAEILNYDLIFNELNKYQDEFSEIRIQLMPETAPVRQEVFNLLIQAYNLLEDKNVK
nr:interaptin-like [Onthophagus taurus]XP_022917055.1 interaptin-like [Onthophagus taurus]XP_022917056.1 interaptin-like [Onthophagus taurus]